MSSTRLTSLGVLELTGDNTRTFLQGQITSDAKSLSPNEAQLGGYTNIKGRLLSVFYLLCLDETKCWMLMPADIIDTVEKTLSRYAAFSRVKVANVSEQYPLYGKLDKNDGDPWSIVGEAINLEGNRQISWAAEKNANQELLAQWVEKDIEAKVPWIYSETLESVLPHYSSLVDLGGVNFEKGCYLGQEIVARMHYKGNIKKHTQILSGFSSPAKPGQALYSREGQKTGVVLYGIANKALCVCDDGKEYVEAEDSPNILMRN